MPDNATTSFAYDSEHILHIRNLTKLFGGLRAVSDFDMAVPEGGLYGLIGPNGAGKTTVFNMVTGLYAPTEGDIHFAGADLVGMPPHEITQAGIGRTFQNIRLFPNLTVLDNVRIAYHTHAGYSLVESDHPPGPLSAARERCSPSAPRTFWPSSACRIASWRSPRTCPMASSAAWRSPAPWPPSRACCCSTSRPRG